MSKEQFVCKNYFVDEAGDLTLFNKKGKIVVGEEGSSNFFMVGMADIPDPATFGQKIEELRGDLLSDPYFKGVPSMQPEAKKTAICFHAKDDLPEVRREVFKLLLSFETKIIVAIRRKQELAEHYQKQFQQNGRKFKDNDVYDDLIKRVFKNSLHKANECNVVFARRGKSDRREALYTALEKARQRFIKKWGEQPQPPLNVEALFPSQSVGLQVVDYYLWALQRMYERSEERFFEAFKPHYKLIMDVDDRRNKGYGEWYQGKNVCELARIKLT